jgi:hypothetical protein
MRGGRSSVLRGVHRQFPLGGSRCPEAEDRCEGEAAVGGDGAERQQHYEHRLRVEARQLPAAERLGNDGEAVRCRTPLFIQPLRKHTSAFHQVWPRQDLKRLLRQDTQVQECQVHLRLHHVHELHFARCRLPPVRGHVTRQEVV